MQRWRLLLLTGIGATAFCVVLPADQALAQVVQAPIVDENFNGIEDSEEEPEVAAPVFDEALQDIEEREDNLPDAPRARPVAADAEEPISEGNRRALRAQQVGIDPGTAALTPLANRPAAPVQGGGEADEDDPYAAIGLRRGSFTLFPTLEQSIGHTTNAGFSADGEGSTFSQTTAALNFTSDWTRHQLRGGVNAGYTNFFDDQFEDLPQGGGNLELRLDGANQLTFTFGGTADLRTESAVAADDDVNIPAGATVDGRPVVQRYTGFAEVAKGGYRLTPSLRLAFDTVSYGDADISSGGTVDQSSRNNTLALATLRLGYEVSPAWRPFAEVVLGSRFYESSADANGNDRNSTLYALRGGVGFGSGEKVNGEIALGYASEMFEDSRLEDLNGFTADASINWSPHRFTTVTAAATTEFVPSTTFNESGSIVYAGTLGVTRDVRANLALNAQIGASKRDYSGSNREETTYTAEIGAIWRLNRTLGVFTTLGHEKVDSSDPSSSYEATTVRGGLRLQR